MTITPAAFRRFKYQIACLDTAERLRQLCHSRLLDNTVMPVSCMLVGMGRPTDDESLYEFLADHENEAPEDFLMPGQEPAFRETDLPLHGGMDEIVLDRIDYCEGFTEDNLLLVPEKLFRLRQRATWKERECIEKGFHLFLTGDEKPQEIGEESDRWVENLLPRLQELKHPRLDTNMLEEAAHCLVQDDLHTRFPISDAGLTNAIDRLVARQPFLFIQGHKGKKKEAVCH